MSCLKEFLEIADVPLLRKDLSMPENVRWLIRNLWIRNSDIEGFKEASDELKQLYDGYVDGRV